ncbi:uncharacterized protein LY89DRAFT_114611 [Mollisia scopiformis]|uniref:Uncharacterized protein n=1 Tax=Mollisia scopiformis TaxID=149040 RepID=A0A194X6R2_MOLSC|nr:uncharacterized protein LY89DRAFT_114611 [Mollisia scopiformis]KUJ15492.1 hypothetical protein LY89DRAFT_114611 [Mollisia scopiformis]
MFRLLVVIVRTRVGRFLFVWWSLVLLVARAPIARINLGSALAPYTRRMTTMIMTRRISMRILEDTKKKMMTTKIDANSAQFKRPTGHYD